MTRVDDSDVTEAGSNPLLPEYHKKSIRSFVIRGGRMTDGQRAAFEKHWPTYGLSLHSRAALEARLQAAKDEGKSIVLEVGFGMGDSLFEMARADQNSLFVGIEVHPPGVGRLMHLAAGEGLSNLCVFMADATDVIKDCFAEACVDRFQLYFPDPWHKAKHHKRRILNEAFLLEILRVLKPSGIFHMATDWEPYAESAMELLSREEALENASGAYLFAERPDYRPETKFERRGERLEHVVRDLLFVKPELR